MASKLKAMVFAAGVGSRLGDITKTVPKCLVPLGNGSTMLDYVIEGLISAGVGEIVINLFHLGSQIKEHVAKKKNYGITVHFSVEATLLNTGGGLKYAQRFFIDSNEPFFVHNSDIFSEIDLRSIFEAHKEKKACATLACMDRQTTRYLLCDERNALVGWDNGPDKQFLLQGKKADKKLGFCGIQVVSPQIFEYMKALTDDFSIISAYLEAAKNGELVQCIDIKDTFWIDMGSPERLEALKTYIVK